MKDNAIHKNIHVNNSVFYTGGILIFLICFVLLKSTPLFAQNELEKLPEITTLDINTFVSQSQKIEKIIESDNALSFSMEIPKNFSIQPDENLKNSVENEKLYGEFFKAVGPAIDEMRPYISVHSVKLDRVISAKNWFLSEALQQNYTLKAIESVNKDNVFEAFYIRLDVYGRTEIVRNRGFLNRGRIVIVEYVLPTALWESDKDRQIFSIKSFDFINENISETSETMVPYSYIESFQMVYPKSWILKVKPDAAVNQHDLNLSTVDINGFPLATIDVTLLSSKSIKDRIDQTIYSADLPSIIKSKTAEIDSLGFIADKVLERKKYDLQFEATLQSTEIYPLRSKPSDVFVEDKIKPVTKEFWLTVIRSPNNVGKNYVVSMLLPSRETDLYNWSVAAKSYELIIESLR